MSSEKWFSFLVAINRLEIKNANKLILSFFYSVYHVSYNIIYVYT